MDPLEREKSLKEKAELKEILRPESAIKHYPMIIKASSVGTLETLIREVEKAAPHLQLIDFGIGPISEADLRNAAKMGAVIFGFDVGIHPPIENKIPPEGVCVRLHKLFNVFMEDVQDYSDYALRDQVD